jgi:hypothetical protein
MPLRPNRFVACVAVAADGAVRRRVADAQAVAALRDRLAALPVADELAAFRVADPHRLVHLLDALGSGLVGSVMHLRAQLLRVVLHDALVPRGVGRLPRRHDRRVGGRVAALAAVDRRAADEEAHAGERGGGVLHQCHPLPPALRSCERTSPLKR